MGTSYYPITYQSINFPPVYTKTIEAAELTEERTKKGTRVSDGVDIYKKNDDNYDKIGTSPLTRAYHFVIINGEEILWTEFIKLDLYVNKPPPMTMPSAGGKRKTRRNRKSNKTRKTFWKSKKGKKLIKSRKGKKMNKSRKRRKTYKKMN